MKCSMALFAISSKLMPLMDRWFMDEDVSTTNTTVALTIAVVVFLMIGLFNFWEVSGGKMESEREYNTPGVWCLWCVMVLSHVHVANCCSVNCSLFVHSFLILIKSLNSDMLSYFFLSRITFLASFITRSSCTFHNRMPTTLLSLK